MKSIAITANCAGCNSVDSRLASGEMVGSSCARERWREIQPRILFHKSEVTTLKSSGEMYCFFSFIFPIVSSVCLRRSTAVFAPFLKLFNVEVTIEWSFTLYSFSNAQINLFMESILYAFVLGDTFFGVQKSWKYN